MAGKVVIHVELGRPEAVKLWQALMNVGGGKFDPGQFALGGAVWPLLGPLTAVLSEHPVVPPAPSEYLPATWSQERDWLLKGCGVNTGRSRPANAEWGVHQESDIFWARMPYPLTLSDAVRLVQYLYSAVQSDDGGEVRIWDDGSYFYVGLGVD